MIRNDVSMSTQDASHSARYTMRLSPRMAASARTALAWLRSGRVSSALAGLLLLSTAVLAAVGDASPLHITSSPLAADLAHPLRLWSLLTAWAGATHLSPLTGVVTLLAVGIALERFIGPRRLVLAAFLPHAIGVGIALVTHPLISAVAPTWGHATNHYQISGTPLILLGPLLASTELMNHTWSRRTRVGVLVFLAVETAVTGTPGALARLATAVAGLLLGMVAWRRSVSSVRLARTRRSSRNLLALLVSCWSLMLALATVTRSDFGPLASVRYGVVPGMDTPRLATGALILSLMPLLLQLALADGLRRGRRAAALGTILLQIFLALCSILSGNVLAVVDGGVVPDSASGPAVIFASSGSWDSPYHIVMPVMLNLGIPFFTGTEMNFIAPVTISTIQLGSTVNYAILLTTRYRKERAGGRAKVDAIETALARSFPAVVTSGLTFFGATIAVAIYSNIGMISQLTGLMARGAFISTLSVLVILPAAFMICDKAIVKTSKGFSASPRKLKEA